MSATVVPLSAARRSRGRVGPKQLLLPAPRHAPRWRAIGKGWEVHQAYDGDVRIRRETRVRVFEAYHVGNGATERYCVCCGNPVAPRSIAYREKDPPAAEPVPWRDIRFCARCIEGDPLGGA